MKYCKICGTENKDQSKFCVGCGAPLEGEKGKRKILLPLTAALLGVVLISIAGFIMYYNSPGQVYIRNVERGDRYAAILRYEDAIIAYESAISAMPDMADGYLRLADIYYILGETENAQATLERGERRTGSVRIQSRREEIFGGSGEQPVRKPGIAVAGQEGEVVRGGEAVSVQEVSPGTETELDWRMIRVFAEFTYADYRRDYGEPQWTNTESGALQADWPGGVFTLLFYDTPENPNVLNAAQGVPHTYTKPTEIQVRDIGILFSGFEGSLAASRIGELCDEVPQVNWDAQNSRHYIDFIYSDCEIGIETDENGNILNPQGWNSIRPIDYGTEEENEQGETSTVSGFVIDAATGRGIYGAALKVTQNGAELQTLYSTGDGSYALELSAGTYQIEVSYGNYVTEQYNLEVREREDQHNINFVLSASLQEGTVRIVLEWGSRPYDLDSYTQGTLSDGTYFGVNFTSPRAQHNGMTVAELDVDDTNGFGPETTTIYDAGASFSFWIQDFRHEDLSDFSSVTVKLYLPGETSPRVYTGSVQSFGISRWNVFSYQDGQVIDNNTYE